MRQAWGFAEPETLGHALPLGLAEEGELACWTAFARRMCGGLRLMRLEEIVKLPDAAGQPQSGHIFATPRVEILLDVFGVSRSAEIAHIKARDLTSSQHTPHHMAPDV